MIVSCVPVSLAGVLTASGAADHNAGTAGVSVTDAFHIATSADSFYYSQTVYSNIGGDAYSGFNGVTGGWSPDIGTPNSPTYFSSGDTVTFTVSNLIPHVALDLDLYGSSTGSPTSGDLVTLTGPDSREFTATTVNDRFIVAAFSTSTSSATFTLKLDIPGIDSDGHARKWNIGGVYLKCQDGFQVMNDASVDVGGVTNVPITVTANDSDQPLAGDVFTLVNYDHSKIQPVGDGTVTLDANGQGVLPIEGLAVGTTPIVLEDAIGDQATANVASLAPQVSSTGSEIEGGTYNTNVSNPGGFTISLPVPSASPVTVYFNTSGSTLPSSVLAQLGTWANISAGQTSTFVQFAMASDNKVAPEMYAVLNLNVAGTAQPPHATLAVDNTNKPTIKVGGLTDGANVTVDLQDDPSLLAPISMSATHDGFLTGEVFTWNPSQDVIWPTHNIGTIGVDDLASMPCTHGNSDGTDSYTLQGAFLTQLFDQPTDGTAIVDGDSVSLGMDVSKQATPSVVYMDQRSTSEADFTSGGTTVIIQASTPVDRPKPTFIVGEKITVGVIFFSQQDPASAPANSFNWTIGGSPLSTYNMSSGAGAPIPLSDASVNTDLQTISFYWYKAGTFSINVSGSLRGHTLKLANPIQCVVVAPSYTLTATHTTDDPAVRVGPQAYDPSRASYLHFGADSDIDLSDGIKETAIVTMNVPTAFGDGSAGLLQLINVQNGTMAKDGGLGHNTKNKFVLDTRPEHPTDPWYVDPVTTPSGKPTTLSPLKDSPNQSAENAVAVFYGAAFLDFLMFRPDLPDSIYVPLTSYDWTFDAIAKLDTAWHITAGFGAKNEYDLVGSPKTNASDPPAWMDYYLNLPTVKYSKGYLPK